MTFRKNLNGLAGGLALAVAGVVATAPVPAHAQFGGIVYDPSNYAQISASLAAKGFVHSTGAPGPVPGCV